MNPKKKSSLPLIISVLSLIFALYFGAALGMALVDKQNSGLHGADLVNGIAEALTDRMNGKLFVGFQLNRMVMGCMMLMFVLWFIVIATLFGNKKNYIKGKEYGTAHWASAADIRPLLANTIKTNQLKDAKKLKTKIGMKLLENKRRSQWKQERTSLLAAETGIMKEKQERALHEVRQIGDLEIQKSEVIDAVQASLLSQEECDGLCKDVKAAAHGRDVVKVMQRFHLQEQANRKKELGDYCDTVWLQEWEPARLKKTLDERLAEIEELAKQKVFITAENKEQQIKAAQDEYAAGIAKFRDYESQRYKITSKYDNADMILTRTERICLYNYLVNLNILVIGGAGCGKSRNFCLPNLLQAHSSFVVTDPKGELLEKCGEFLKRKGYTIRVLNLDEKKDSDCYNPFKYIHPERDGYEERILTLIQTIIANTTKDKSSSQDPFWENAEKLFLQALFFFVTDGFSEKYRNINTVMDLIALLEIAEENDKRNSPLDIFAEEFERRLNEADKEHHSAGSDNNGVKAWKEFRSKAAGKTAKGIVISTVARLSALRPSGIRRIMSHDDMMLERLGEEKMAVFVVVPPVDETFNFIAGMLFTQMFQELQYCALQVHKHDGQRCPVTVRFILDEFATTCTIPNFTKILAYARSLGIGIVPVIQSIEQIKTIYEKDWGAIVDNCSSLLYLGGDTTDASLKFISDLLGKGTFDKKTTGHSRGRSGSSSENFDVIGRELMTPDEVRRLAKDECILIVNSRPPFHSKKYKYESHPNYILTSDADPKNSYYHIPVTHTEPEEPKVEETKPKSTVIERTPEEWYNLIMKRKNAIMEEIDREIQTVTLETDVQTIMRVSANKLTRLQVADMDVDDGEQPISLEEVKENKKAVAQQIDDDIAQLLDDPEPDAEPAVKMETAAEDVIKNLTQNIDKLVPADTAVADGEEPDDPDAFFEEDAEDDDSINTEVQENLGETVADHFDNLADLIDADEESGDSVEDE